MNDFRNQIYADYNDFKNWSFGEYEAGGETYEIEFQRLKVKSPHRILEIGFGSGGFLSWANSKGHIVSGTEVNPYFIEQAHKRGFEVYESADLAPLIEKTAKYDLVVAFDVLEHMYPLEIKELLAQTKTLLNSGGKAFFRFPNSISPFCGQSQYGDITHVTTMSVEKLMQLAEPMGFKLGYQANAPRPINHGKRSKFARKALYFLRGFIEILIGYTYFGGKVPLDPNLSVMLYLDNKDSI